MFKDLNNGLFGIINLNNESKTYVETVEKGDLLDSEFCSQVVSHCESKYAVDYTYGGWMEDRSFLWKGSYLEKTGNFTHLGVDFNVPVGTKVYADDEMQVIRVENDFPLVHGWGQMIIGYVKHLNVCILYGHLAANNSWKVGDVIKRGEVVGEVGQKNENGFWFPHLHVQTITKEYFDEVEARNGWEDFDGYTSPADLSKAATIYKDPLNFLSIK